MTDIIREMDTNKILFWTLSGILLLCMGFYMFCINVTIRNVVAREQLETKSSALLLSIWNKEFQYITQRNAVTLPLAYSLGFKEVTSKTYISKKSVSYVSYVNKEI